MVVGSKNKVLVLEQELDNIEDNWHSLAVTLHTHTVAQELYHLQELFH